MVVTCSVLEDLKYSGKGCDEEYNNQMVKEINSVLYVSYHNRASRNKNLAEPPSKYIKIYSKTTCIQHYIN